MKLREFFARGTARAIIAICLTLSLLSLYAASARTQSQPQTQSQSQDTSQSQSQTQTGSSSSAPAQSDDAAAKAAERKRKFDEQRKMMEGGYSPSKEESSRGKADPDLMLSPMDVNLLVGDRVVFHLYDKGKEVTGSSWSAMPGRVLASWFDKRMLVIEAKSPGTARVGVEYNRRYTNVIVTVYAGDKMPKGIDRTVEAMKPAGSQ